MINRYFTRSISLLTLLLMGFSCIYGQAIEDSLKSTNEPTLTHGGGIHAYIDTVSNSVFVANSEGLWEYNIEVNRWNYLLSLGQLPNPLSQLESGYDSKNGVFYFWDRGVGSVYEVDPKSKSFVKLDESHSHRNQYNHQPFIKDGTIYAFGGYGYWSWKNYITYFNQNLGEWNVQNVNPASTLPSARIPETGVYLPERDEFFIYGGHAPDSKLRADDQYTERINLKDIWKFSFGDNTWQKIGEINSEYQYYTGSNYRRYGRINKTSGSFYSGESKFWYIPTVAGGRGDLLYLTPIDIESEKILHPIAVDKAKLDAFVPSNFLFNQKTSKLILVGVEKATGVKTFPIKIIEIPKDSLLVKIEQPSLLAESNINIYWGGAIIILIIGFIFYLRNGQKIHEETSGKKIRLDELDDITWLKEEEKRLLNTLIEQESAMESDQLEVSVWSNVENYDYRRKLRNETIKNINRKFKKHLNTDSNIVERIKDPEDNRRNLYKINDAYLDRSYS